MHKLCLVPQILCIYLAVTQSCLQSFQSGHIADDRYAWNMCGFQNYLYLCSRKNNVYEVSSRVILQITDMQGLRAVSRIAFGLSNYMYLFIRSK